MDIKLNEIVISFTLFFLIFLANTLLIRKVLVSKLNKKLIILAIYPFKLLIYTGVIFMIHKIFGITYNTLFGITLSLIVTSAVIFFTRHHQQL